MGSKEGNSKGRSTLQTNSFQRILKPDTNTKGLPAVYVITIWYSMMPIVVRGLVSLCCVAYVQRTASQSSLASRLCPDRQPKTTSSVSTVKTADKSPLPSQIHSINLHKWIVTAMNGVFANFRLCKFHSHYGVHILKMAPSSKPGTVFAMHSCRRQLMPPSHRFLPQSPTTTSLPMLSSRKTTHLLLPILTVNWELVSTLSTAAGPWRHLNLSWGYFAVR